MHWYALILAADLPAAKKAIPLLSSDAGAKITEVVVPCILSALVSYLVVKHELKQSHRQALHDRITHLLDIGIEHPYLEDSDWCNSFSPDLPDMEKRVRYELYCCAVFNLLEDVWKFSGGNRQRIRKFMHAEEYVLAHKLWWQHDPQNEKAYDKGFRDFVQNILQVKGTTT